MPLRAALLHVRVTSGGEWDDLFVMKFTTELLNELLKTGLKVEFRYDGAFTVSLGGQVWFTRKPHQGEPNRFKIMGITAKEWSARRKIVLDRDGHKCTYCGSDGNGKPLHCDHIVPLASGGSSEIDNLAAACKSCNSSKRSKPLIDWRSGW